LGDPPGKLLSNEGSYLANGLSALHILVDAISSPSSSPHVAKVSAEESEWLSVGQDYEVVT